MKKVIYLSATLAYAALGIIGAAANSYAETGAFSKLMRSAGAWLIIVAVVASFLVVYYFPKVFPKGYRIQKKAGKIALLVVLTCLTFALTIGFFKFINSNLGRQTLLTINGRISNKWTERGSKGSRSYYLKLRDDASGDYFEFKVKKRVYERIGFMGSTITKDFYIGSLGIIYRNRY